jgi:hypothetical protein
MYSTQSQRKTWHAQFCCTTRGIDPYVPTCATQLYTCQGTRYPICGYQSSNGMLQDSELVKLKDWVTNVEKLFTQSKIKGQPFFKIDFSLMKPINIMARSSHNIE